MFKNLVRSGRATTAPGVETGPAWQPESGQGVGTAATALIDPPTRVVTSADAIAPAGLRHRRREPRYLAIENRLWMQWWEDGEYLGRSAQLVNVSRHGAMIITWVLFREQQRLRVYLEEPAPQIGVEAIVLGVVEAISGMHQVRLGFDSPCPDLFMDAAANGFDSWLCGENLAF